MNGKVLDILVPEQEERYPPIRGRSAKVRVNRVIGNALQLLVAIILKGLPVAVIVLAANTVGNNQHGVQAWRLGPMPKAVPIASPQPTKKQAAEATFDIFEGPHVMRDSQLPKNHDQLAYPSKSDELVLRQPSPPRPQSSRSSEELDFFQGRHVMSDSQLPKNHDQLAYPSKSDELVLLPLSPPRPQSSRPSKELDFFKGRHVMSDSQLPENHDELAYPNIFDELVLPLPSPTRPQSSRKLSPPPPSDLEIMITLLALTDELSELSTLPLSYGLSDAQPPLLLQPRPQSCEPSKERSQAKLSELEMPIALLNALFPPPQSFGLLEERPPLSRPQSSGPSKERSPPTLSELEMPFALLAAPSPPPRSSGLLGERSLPKLSELEMSFALLNALFPPPQSFGLLEERPSPPPCHSHMELHIPPLLPQSPELFEERPPLVTETFVEEQRPPQSSEPLRLAFPPWHSQPPAETSAVIKRQYILCNSQLPANKEDLMHIIATRSNLRFYDPPPPQSPPAARLPPPFLGQFPGPGDSDKCVFVEVYGNITTDDSGSSSLITDHDWTLTECLKINDKPDSQPTRVGINNYAYFFSFEQLFYGTPFASMYSSFAHKDTDALDLFVKLFLSWRFGGIAANLDGGFFNIRAAKEFESHATKVVSRDFVYSKLPCLPRIGNLLKSISKATDFSSMQFFKDQSFTRHLS